MAEVAPVDATISNPTRFARIAAAAALAFALVGLLKASLPLEAAGIVCALFGLVVAVRARELYAGAGCVVAAVIALTSAPVSAAYSTFAARQTEARAAHAAQVAADIAEVEQYDAHMIAYQTADAASVERTTQAFSRATDTLARLRDRYQLASLSAPEERANIRAAMQAVTNDIEVGHRRLQEAKSTMDQRFAEVPAKWAHIQQLCGKAKVRDAEACGRIVRDRELYLERVKQSFASLDRMLAAYNAEQPKQQAILDAVS